MNRKAYLVAHIDVESMAIIRVGIFSSPARNLTCFKNEIYADIISEEGKSYSKAKENLIALMRYQNGPLSKLVDRLT